MAYVKSFDPSAKNFVSGIQHLLRGRESSVLIMKEVLWKNKLQSVKDVPKVRVNLISIVIVVPLKRNGITFCTALLSWLRCFYYNCVTN